MDRIDELSKRLKKVKESYELWKNPGLNEEVLIIYLKDKTKLSKKKIIQILKEQDTFFDNLMKEEVVKRLEAK